MSDNRPTNESEEYLLEKSALLKFRGDLERNAYRHGSVTITISRYLADEFVKYGIVENPKYPFIILE